MSTKENSEVAVEKVTENTKPNADAKCEIKGIKRAAEVSFIFIMHFFFYSRTVHLYIHGRDDHVRRTRSRRSVSHSLSRAHSGCLYYTVLQGTRPRAGRRCATPFSLSARRAPRAPIALSRRLVAASVRTDFSTFPSVFHRRGSKERSRATEPRARALLCVRSVGEKMARRAP